MNDVVTNRKPLTDTYKHTFWLNLQFLRKKGFPKSPMVLVHSADIDSKEVADPARENAYKTLEIFFGMRRIPNGGIVCLILSGC